MSYDEHLREKKKGKGRGKVDVARSLAGLGQGTGTRTVADWGDAHPDLITGLLLEVTRRGGALSLGLSRDKGAFNITIFLDGDRQTIWVPAGDEIDAKLEAALHYMASLPE